MEDYYRPRDEQFDPFGMESPFAPFPAGIGEAPRSGEQFTPLWFPPVAVKIATQALAISSPANPPGLMDMLTIPGRFDDPKRDLALEMDGTLFSEFLRGADRRAFAAQWLSSRLTLVDATKEPESDIMASDINKAWFVIHDVGVGGSLKDRHYYPAKQGLKQKSVHGFLNRGGFYAAIHDFAANKSGTVYEFLSRKGRNIAGGRTINIETVPDVETRKIGRDKALPQPSNAADYASVGFKQKAGTVTYYKWSNAAFDTLADLYILASARAGHLLTVTVHKEIDRNLGRSVIWNEYSAKEMRNAGPKVCCSSGCKGPHLARARDCPQNYHGDPFAFDVQALYNRITERLNALTGKQMPPGARYGVHPSRLRKVDGSDITNGSSHLHEFPHQSDPVVKRDTNMKALGWWNIAPANKSEDESPWKEAEWAAFATDEAGTSDEAGLDGEEEHGSACGSHQFEGEESEAMSDETDLEDLGGAWADSAEPEDLAWLDLEHDEVCRCASCRSAGEVQSASDHEAFDDEAVEHDRKVEDQFGAHTSDIEYKFDSDPSSVFEFDDEFERETENEWRETAPTDFRIFENALESEEKGSANVSEAQFGGDQGGADDWLEEIDLGFEEQISQRAGAKVFRFANLPPTVQALLSKPSQWIEALDAAISAGIKDSRYLADIIFFMRHPERMNAGVGKPIDRREKEFVWLRAEWLHDETIAARRLNPALNPSVFLAACRTREYATYIAPPTSGLVMLMPHGRSLSSAGTVRNELSALDKMQMAVEALGKGDSLFIANWQFIPGDLDLTLDRPGLVSWLDLLVSKATEGVVIRVIISFIPLAGFSSPLLPLEAALANVDTKVRDNFKYFVSEHKISTGTHHQKFLIARSKTKKIVFCGGLDISRNRAPNSKRARASWSTDFVWHDVHSQLEGRIVLDFEREFAMRWNLERRTSKTKLQLGWKPFETLGLNPQSAADKSANKNLHKVQMLRTVSVGATPADFRRDDIWQGYCRLIARAKKFLYLENQYFREPRLADAIVRQAQSQKDLLVMILVSTGTDDKKDLINDFANGLRLDFFTRLFNGIPSDRRRVYSIAYPAGLLHSKLIMADDEVLSVGSANANPRGFFVDSEVNIMVDDSKVVEEFRHRLWEHNLGLDASSVARWSISEYFERWDKVAGFNRGMELKSQPDKMIGESVIPFNPVDPNDSRFERGRNPPRSLWPQFES